MKKMEKQEEKKKGAQSQARDGYLGTRGLC